jgi:hypothetical protein
MTVCGLTMASAERHPDHSLESHTQKETIAGTETDTSSLAPSKDYDLVS